MACTESILSKELFEQEVLDDENDTICSCSGCLVTPVFPTVMDKAAQCSTGIKLAPEDDQSTITVPTVALTYREAEDKYYCEHCGVKCNCCDSVSMASTSFTSLNCVSFDVTPQVFEIPSRHEYTTEEIEAAWYSRREKEVMKAAVYGIAESLGLDYFESNCDDYSQVQEPQSMSTRFRGLEAYTQQGSDRRKLHRVKNLVAVLREQRRQRSCEELVVNGEELVEAACHSVSTKCLQLAYAQGLRDEIDAREPSKSSCKDQSPNMILQLTRVLRGSSESSLRDLET